jgi:hypothetical protein
VAVGRTILVALFFYRPSPLLILMAVLAAPQLVKAWRGIRTPEEQAYYVASTETRFQLWVVVSGVGRVSCHHVRRALPGVAARAVMTASTLFGCSPRRPGLKCGPSLRAGIQRSLPLSALEVARRSVGSVAGLVGLAPLPEV